MGMFRLDIKKNILMKREGSHVGDVLIKMSEWPGHCCAPPSSAPAGYKQGHAASGGMEPGLLPASLPWEVLLNYPSDHLESLLYRCTPVWNTAHTHRVWESYLCPDLSHYQLD